MLAHGQHRAARDGLRLRADDAGRSATGSTRAGGRALLLPEARRVVEDPGTGSACANLGGWLLATGAPLPQRLAIAQGDAVGTSVPTRRSRSTPSGAST